ncbi:MAG: sugar transferase [Sulfurimonas sp.]|nr:sugar transferase [Sulfurimonas sp.]
MKTSKFNPYSYIFSLLLIAIDLLALIFSLELATLIRANSFTQILPLFEATSNYKYYWIIVIILFMFIFEKIYFTRYDFWGDTKRVLKGLLFSSLAVFTVISLTKISDEHSRTFIVIFFILAFIIVPTLKRIFKKILFNFDIFKIKVKIVANDPQYDLLYNEIRDNWYFGFKNTQKDYDMVIISSNKFDIIDLQNIIKKYTKKTKDIYVVPYMNHLDFSHTEIVDYSNIRLSALHIENRLLNYKNILIKYFFEKLLVILILPFVLLLHVIILIVIKFDSKGSVIFKQKRLGKNSKIFNCYKYRTMYVQNQNILDNYLKNNPDEVEHFEIYHKYKNDPRTTKIGKFLRKTSLDEFPQFYNVLKGNMNLIGPRPYMLNEKEKIGSFNEELILKVKPGITGLWQVNGRNELTFKQRVDLDTWYIQNWSLWMDFVIFMKTLKVVFLKI